jgi:pSer/pThr/pTyr-binding forkhead associated (FHA) protein
VSHVLPHKAQVAQHLVYRRQYDDLSAPHPYRVPGHATTELARKATSQSISRGGAHARRGKDQHVIDPNNDQTTDKATGDATSAFCADFLGDFDTPTDIAEAGVGQDGLPSGSPVLVVKRGPNAGSRFRLDQPVTSAGRHPDSGIFLDDVSVSRRHAEFRRDNGECVVVDTASLNGTYVNRKPVESVALANGDEIQMGKFRLVFLNRPHDALTPTASHQSVKP